MVTVDPLAAVLRGAGLLREDGAVRVLGRPRPCWTLTANPAVVRIWLAVCWESPMTEGTDTAPPETVIVTVEPGAAVPPLGLWLTTVPDGRGGRRVGLDRDLEALGLQRGLRRALLLADHVGHRDRRRSGGDVQRHQGVRGDVVALRRIGADHQALGDVAAGLVDHGRAQLRLGDLLLRRGDGLVVHQRHRVGLAPGEQVVGHADDDAEDEHQPEHPRYPPVPAAAPRPPS